MVDRGFGAVAVGAVALAIAGCSDQSDTAEPAAATPAVSAAANDAGPPVAPVGFDLVAVTLTPDDGDPIELTMWFAGTSSQHAQGLTGVTDLGGADGMLFAFDEPAPYQFYMWQTPLPLDIVFFDDRGRFVGNAAMNPCLGRSSSGCERYSPARPFMMAIEVPAGALDDLALDESWTISYAPLATTASTVAD